MRRLSQSDDDGAIALIVALLLVGGVILGLAALTMDIGMIYAERRQVQNGADSATLALAKSCAGTATCDTSLTGAARVMADLNANDKATRITRICGAGATGLTGGCPGQTGPELAKCPPVPTGTASWIRVTTATARSGGSTLLPPIFGQTLAGNSGYDGVSVAACAQAAWGTPSSLGSLPVTFSECEWHKATNNGATYPSPLPPYPPFPTSDESILLTKYTGDGPACPADPAGKDLPGAFGWLKPDPKCAAITNANGDVLTDTGNVPPACVDQSWLSGYLNKIIYIPIHSKAVGTGANVTYSISGYGAFYLTGWYLGGSEKQKSSKTNAFPCGGSDRCISGYFTKGIVPTSGPLGSGSDFGAKVIALIG